MKEVIGVRFRRNGKVYYYDPRGLATELGTKVIVDTPKGIEFGWVVIPSREVDEEKLRDGLKPIQRLATPQDIERYEKNKERSKAAFQVCQSKIRESGLEMKLISAEYSFDNSKVVFYFTADGRVDFRELVKNLAHALHIRIELRQVGVRDDARIRGGIGMCGRELCCHSYLSDFIPVSIRMAKEQGLSLNPTKISGVCNRLMCCLKHEEETYEYLNSLLPNVGDRVKAYDGVTGEVASVSVLRQRVKIYVTDEDGNKELVEYKIGELREGPRGRRFEPDNSDDEEELDRELSGLEDYEHMISEIHEPEGSAQSSSRGRNRDGGHRRKDAGEGGRPENRQEKNSERQNRPKKKPAGDRKESEEQGKQGTQGRRNRSEDGRHAPQQNRNEDGKRVAGQGKGGEGRHGDKQNRNGGQQNQQNRNADQQNRNAGQQNRNMNPKRDNPDNADRKPNPGKAGQRKNRPNNRPRESRKPSGQQGQ